MAQQKLLFIFNPMAGRGDIVDDLFDTVNRFTRAGFLVTAYPTQKQGDARKITEALAGQYDLVVCAGGDGTLNEVVSGLMGLPCRPLMGYIPVGTTNDFATSMEISRDYQMAVEAIISGQPFAFDVGSFNHVYFSYVAAFGAFTNVPYDTSQEMKNMFGHTAYWLEGIKQLASIKTYHCRMIHDGGVLEDDFMLGIISSSISVAGFKGYAGTGVALDDGLFEVLLVKRPPNLPEASNMAASLLTHGAQSDYLHMFRSSRLYVETEDKPRWTLDGEYGGNPSRAEIINHRQAISIMLAGRPQL